MNDLDSFFKFLETNHFFAIGLWIILGYIFSKFYDVFLYQRISKSLFFKSYENKMSWLAVLFVGIILLILTLIVEIFYKAHLMWYVLSILVIFGSVLGLLPFSFHKDDE